MEIKRITKEPFFSVVIPVYNKEPHIARSINSVLNQTFEDFELIVVCDPSTDNSNAEVEKFTDSRIRVFYRDKSGPGGYATRNLGIKEAKAEWIAFLDADDEWYPMHLKEASLVIHQNSEVDFVFFNFNKKKDGVVSPEHKLKENKKLTRLEILQLFSQHALMHTNSIIAKKSKLQDAGLFPEGKTKRGGDSDLWLRLIIVSETAIWSHKITSIYEIDNSGVIADSSTLGTKHIMVDTVAKLIEDDKRTKSEKVYLKKLSNRKSFEWALSRKRQGLFEYSEIKDFYFSVFGMVDWLYVSILILPNFFAKMLYRVKRVFS